MKRTLKKLSFDINFKTISWRVGRLDPNEFLKFSSLKSYNFWTDHFSAKQKYTRQIIFWLLSTACIRFIAISMDFSGNIWACHILMVIQNVKWIYAKVGSKMLYTQNFFYKISSMFSTRKLLKTTGGGIATDSTCGRHITTLQGIELLLENNWNHINLWIKD